MARCSAYVSFAVFIMTALLVPGIVREADAGITCGQVASSLSQCIKYLQNQGPLVPGCCNGVRSLNSLASTTPDRQTACSCLKSLSGSIRNLKTQLAAGLPGKCGVSIPYPISTSTNCAAVH